MEYNFYCDESLHLPNDRSKKKFIPERIDNSLKAAKEREKFLKPLSTSVTKKELSVSKRISYIRNKLKESKNESIDKKDVKTLEIALKEDEVIVDPPKKKKKDK